MEDVEMSIIKEIFKKYNIVYDSVRKIVYVNSPINTLDFIYLKRMLGITTLEIEDIRVGDAKI